MKILTVVVGAALAASAFGEITYCERGTRTEHTHFSSHDIPSAKGVRVKQKGPDCFACTTNEHPLVTWSRPLRDGRVELSIDIRPIDKEKSDLFVKWIEAGRIEGESAQMPVEGDWTEKANAVMNIGNVDAVAADLASEKECAWRHLSAVPAEGGMVVLVDFRVVAGTAAAAEKLAGEVGSQIGQTLSEFELLNPVVTKDERRAATAWFVTPTNAVTCAHCTRGMSKYWFTDEHGERVSLKVVDVDEEGDVALLAVADPHWRSPVSLQVAQKVPRLSEKVWTLGYPLAHFLGGSIKYGEGVVSSHEGLRGSDRLFTVTAPIRPGASGGPVFDDSGRVCGVMASTLIARWIFKEIGHVSPESNFAVKVDNVRAMLEKHGIPFDAAGKRKLPKSRADAIEKASRAVILLNTSRK